MLVRSRKFMLNLSVHNSYINNFITGRTLVATLLFSLACCTMGLSAARAQEQEIKGSWGVGIIASSVSDPMHTSCNSKLDSLTKKPGPCSSLMPIGFFELNVQRGQWQYYGGMPLEGAGSIMFGGKRAMGQRSVLEIAVSVSPFMNTWKDPYLTGRGRDKTPLLQYGLKVAYEGIAETPLNLAVSVSAIEVGNDKAWGGDARLKRSGTHGDVTLSMSIMAAAGLLLKPAVVVERMDAEGVAEQYDGRGVEIAMMRFGERSMVHAAAAITQREYGGRHPLFGKTREDRSGKYIVMYTRFPSETFHFSTSAGIIYERGNSNIEFHDAHSVMTLLTVGSSF